MKLIEQESGAEIQIVVVGDLEVRAKLGSREVTVGASYEFRGGSVEQAVSQAIRELTSSYGYCPFCDSVVTSRERRINGNDQCTRGHVYPSKMTKEDKG